LIYPYHRIHVRKYFKIILFILIRFNKLIVVQTLCQQKKYSYVFYTSRMSSVSKKQKKIQYVLRKRKINYFKYFIHEIRKRITIEMSKGSVECGKRHLVYISRGKKMGHKVGGELFGNSVPQNPSPLALPSPPRGSFNSPTQTPSPRRRAELHVGGLYLLLSPPAAPRSTSADAARSSLSQSKQSGGSDWFAGCLLMLVVSSLRPLGWIRFFRSISGSPVPLSNSSSSSPSVQLVGCALHAAAAAAEVCKID